MDINNINTVEQYIAFDREQLSYCYTKLITEGQEFDVVPMLLGKLDDGMPVMGMFIIGLKMPVADILEDIIAAVEDYYNNPMDPD